jgi:MFS family permease
MAEETAIPTSGPPAGWYPDPDNPDAARRYWDGRRWTDSRAPVEAEAGPRNGMAVTAFVLGLVGVTLGAVIAVLFFPIPLGLGLAAFVLGWIARRRATRDPAAGRKGMATWGVVLGLLSVGIGIIGAVAVNSAVNDLDKALSTHCLNHPDASDCP